MKWRVVVVAPSDMAQTRVVRKFLFFPKRIGDEWRWLEWATISQTRRIKYDTFGLGAIPYTEWVDSVWED